MKILYLTGNDVGCFIDFLFNGIVDLLGHDSVVDYPYAEHRHVKDIAGARELEFRNSMGRYFYLSSTIDKDSDNRKRYSFAELVQLINEGFFDLVIAGTRAEEIFVQLVNATGARFPRAIIVNEEDDSDRFYYNTVMPMLSKYPEHISLILERDYKNNINYESKVVPFVLPCPVNILPNFDYKKDKEIDVFCSVNRTHPFREKVVERIKLIKGINVVASYGGLKIDDYYRCMNNSRISISISGSGWDSSHYLEVPYVKSMLLAQHPRNFLDHSFKEAPVIYPNNFKDRHSAAFYKTDLSDMEEVIRYYIANDEDREEITRRGYEHLVNNLTTKKMAEYVFKCLNDNSYWKSLPLT